MRIAFFGSRHAFDYHHIGGTDSLVRRLSLALVHFGVSEVALITYGHTDQAGQEIHSSGLCSLYFRDLGTALDALRQYDHVVTIYLLPKDRLKFMLFRTRTGGQVQFHMLFQCWPDSPLKRMLMIADAALVRYNGRVFGVSPRLVKYIERWVSPATLLLPPVPPDYFVPLPLKLDSKRIKVAFLGRVDPGKGVIETVQIFNELSNYPDVELFFCGMHWPHDPRSVHLHEILLTQERFRYVPVSFDSYTEATDNMVRSTLADTDILLQPYRRLSSTIDTPMLILEAMASLTPVITRPFGDIPRIYGPSPCLLAGQDVVGKAIALVLSARSWLAAERERIDQQNKSIHFDLDSVVNVFCDALGLC